MSQEIQIIDKATILFFNYGVKSITMSSLANELGISKKTLYLHLENKENLVNKTIESYINKELFLINKIVEDVPQAIDQFIEIAKNNIIKLRKMHPTSLYDIKKYYSNAWSLINNFKNECIYGIIQNNINLGKKQGLYKVNIDVDVVTRLYLNNIDFLVNALEFPPSKYKLSNLYEQFIEYHLQGIASKKGLVYLEKIQFIEKNA